MIEQIKKDMIEAMKSKDKVRLSTLRMLISAIDNERISSKSETITDDMVVTCINRNLKQLKQEIDSIINASREIGTQINQVEILESYLPKQLSDEAVRNFVIDIINKVKDRDGNFGEVMKILSSNLKGKADMGKVSKLAKELF